MSEKQTKFTVYRIYYDNIVVYVGRTKQPLQSRIRGHLFQKPMHRTIDINQVSRIEFAELKTEADMNLYEIFYILCLHPALNVDDKTRDYPTLSLPGLAWTEWHTALWDKWKHEIEDNDNRVNTKREKLNRITEQIHVLRGLRRTGELLEDEFFDKYDVLQSELVNAKTALNFGRKGTVC